MQIRAWDDMLLLLLFVAHGLPLIAFCWYVFFFSFVYLCPLEEFLHSGFVSFFLVGGVYYR
jgi:hypothetical protein